MTVTAISNSQGIISSGNIWELIVQVREWDRLLTDVEPTIIVTPPSGSDVTLTVERIDTGTYRAEYQPVTAGRYTATATATALGVATFTTYAVGVTANASLPQVADVKSYLKGTTSWSDAEIQKALDAETFAQRNRCRVRAEMVPDLREALMRRVACNLGRRAITVGGVQQGDAEAAAPLPTYDPEIRRLEGPYRRVLIG